MKLLLLGPQASGKGTQANLIAKEFGIPHISTGDILRKNIKDQTELGKIAKEIIDRGELVSDDIINQVVENRLKESDCIGGFVLDGYPRNIGQSKFLDSVLKLDRAIEIHVSDDEAIKRISGRRICESCGCIFSVSQDNLTEDSVCSKCAGKLLIRDDDQIDAIKKRLHIYHNETEPLVDYYKEQGILLQIDGARPIDVIFKDLLSNLK